MMSRRWIALLAVMFTTAVVTASAPPASAFAMSADHRTESGPPSVSPADIRFTHRVLRIGRAHQVGLLPEQVQRMRVDLERYLTPAPDHPRHPVYAGAVLLAAKQGVIVQRVAVGMAVRYSAVGPPPDRVGVELPLEQQIPTRPDTIFDIASITKVFTAIAVLQQVEAGRVALDAPVAAYVPEFAAGGKQAVTVRMLLTHTSGLPAWVPLWRYPTPAERLTAALATPLRRGATPGGQYEYSDLGYIALGALVERTTGRRLDEVVRTGITGPLSMTETGYNPGPDLRVRIAATEYQTDPARGMVWGEVHDENAWSLGGVAGHAGIFSTADDLAILCQTMLNGGEYRGRRILRETTVRSMLVNYNAYLKTRFPESDRGLGFALNRHSYMGALSSPVTFGHTGFTGPSLVVDPLSHSFVILLSNRVHPDHTWGDRYVAGHAIARDLGDAMPVRPPLGGAAWRAERRDGTTVTLTAPLRRPVDDAAVASFLLWYDTEPGYDVLRFETSSDGGITWLPGVMTLRSFAGRFDAGSSVTGYGGRRWWHVSAPLPSGTTHVRWSYATDSTAQGRGVYIDWVLVFSHGRLIFNGEAGDADRFEVNGWVPART